MTEVRSDDPLVETLMTTDVDAIDPQASAKDAAALMRKSGHGALLVVRNRITAGIVTEGDLVKKLLADAVDPTKVRVSDVMSSSLVTISPKAGMREAAERMSAFGIRRIVVADEDGALVGLLTTSDLARFCAAEKGYSDNALNAIARLKKDGTGGPYE